jgi:hypothetical protein
MKYYFSFLFIILLISFANAQGCLPDGITFSSQEQIDNFPLDYPGCNNIIGFVEIHDEGSDVITNLDSLAVLHSITGNFEIVVNPHLLNIKGLKNLTNIGGGFNIHANSLLTSLEGLDSLSSVGGMLVVQWNDSLKDIRNLGKLSSVGWSLQIIENNSLSSLTGLDNINASLLPGLLILNNRVLSTCEVKSVCEFLSNPLSQCDIQYNAPGCNSRDEVEQACYNLGINAFDYIHYSFYPNPSSEQIIIKTLSNLIMRELFIINSIGQIISSHKKNENEVTIEIKNLPAGIYYLKIIGDKTVQIRKFIKK